MGKALTVKSVENAKARAIRAEIPDGALAGLYLVVQPSGVKSWAVRYRFAGRPKKHTIGSWPAIDLVGARKLGGAAIRAVAEGRDPGDEKKAARRKAGDGQDTIEAVAEHFIERYAKRNTRETTWRETARILGFKPAPDEPAKLIKSDTGGEVLSKWKGRTVHEIRRADVLELLDGIVDRGSAITANRVLAVVRKMFAWAASRDIIATSPCAGVKPPTAETTRDRVLSDAELKTVWQACDKIDWPFGPVVKLLLLTAQRRDEVAEMRWSEIDVESKTWTLARERVKNDQAHVVPLSDAAIAVLESLPRVKGNAGFVFTTTGETPVAGFSRAKGRLDDAILELVDQAPLRWTFHDLRRTAASGMARLGINLPVIEKVLNHTSGSFGGIVGIYQRHSFAEEKRAALETWGRFVKSLIEGKQSNVVELAVNIRRASGE